VAYNEIDRKEISPMKALIPILLLFGCAIAPAEELSPAVVANLRAMGPAGLQQLLDRAASDPSAGESPGFQAALDTVCAQHDCAASHLYWYTDLAAARAEARRTGKPILSLRLLGRLDEELSCANSRFFRAVLYPDPEVSRLLRDRFVLHWQSMRPVPKVTIDFGDGRRLVGTVTGNSIHYVLDANGRLVDALPGLNGPGAFLRFLEGTAAEAGRMAALDDAGYVRELKAYHIDRRAAAQAALTEDFRRLGAVDPERAAAAVVFSGPWTGPREQPALRASERTVGKSTAELPLLLAMSPGAGLMRAPGVARSPVAELHRQDAKLSEASRRLLLAKAGTWMKIEDPQRAVGSFEDLIVEDTVRNEYILHSRIHAWLAASRGVPDLAKFNENVYSQIFLTPSSDPWLGLAPQEIYAVLTPEPEGSAASAP
jgi:hypothetical protein